MTEEVKEQDVELTEDETVEEAHDPKNAEAQSVDSVDKAGDMTGKAKMPNMGTAKNNTKQDPMPKTKAGMINAMNMKLMGMKKHDLMASYGKMMGMGEELEASEDATVVEQETPEVKYDYNGELNALVESEATLSEEFKAKTAIIFESALKSKLAEEIDRLEASYKEELESEVNATKSDLVEKVDSYLNYVVESWMEENKVAIQDGLRTEIAENFMSKKKDLFEESYVEVPESKVDLVEEISQQNKELEQAHNDAMKRSLALAEEVENFKRDRVIRSASKDLAETQVEKLNKLVENIDFEDEDTFAEKVKIIKETNFNKKSTAESPIVEDTESTAEEEVEVSGTMAQYVQALKKTGVQ